LAHYSHRGIWAREKVGHRVIAGITIRWESSRCFVQCWAWLASEKFCWDIEAELRKSLMVKQSRADPRRWHPQRRARWESSCEGRGHFPHASCSRPPLQTRDCGNSRLIPTRTTLLHRLDMGMRWSCVLIVSDDGGGQVYAVYDWPALCLSLPRQTLRLASSHGNPTSSPARSRYCKGGGQVGSEWTHLLKDSRLQMLLDDFAGPLDHGSR
jgi:hypothetical protein